MRTFLIEFAGWLIEEFDLDSEYQITAEELVDKFLNRKVEKNA